jgi:hypothetical protein
MIPGLTKQQSQLILVGAGIAFAGYFLLRRPVQAVGGALEGTLVGEDSPYHGTGLVGTVAAGANVASGGLFQRLGSFIGRTAADLTDKVTGRNDEQDFIR